MWLVPSHIIMQALVAVIIFLVVMLITTKPQDRIGHGGTLIFFSIVLFIGWILWKCPNLLEVIMM